MFERRILKVDVNIEEEKQLPVVTLSERKLPNKVFRSYACSQTGVEGGISCVYVGILRWGQ